MQIWNEVYGNIIVYNLEKYCYIISNCTKIAKFYSFHIFYFEFLSLLGDYDKQAQLIW